ncbi:hypothetical protein PGTUg99_031588, partial [Puccinia graminis f. sp. tritici]
DTTTLSLGIGTWLPHAINDRPEGHKSQMPRLQPSAVVAVPEIKLKDPVRKITQAQLGPADKLSKVLLPISGILELRTRGHRKQTQDLGPSFSTLPIP